MMEDGTIMNPIAYIKRIRKNIGIYSIIICLIGIR